MNTNQYIAIISLVPICAAIMRECYILWMVAKNEDKSSSLENLLFASTSMAGLVCLSIVAVACVKVIFSLS